ncbi:N-acetylmannosamine-6-phosphate 2-epimerase [Clostridium sp. AF19-22AC]|jgi:N-acylglucosamine-6-phosphate 2-epimerase|uniref:Putative N-acetylmannosamine-6-phosphate 2-epimerase n=1 Tax=Faecalicatena orotica TaxID=1544 RepID=A0A2Y9BEM6_9FIRM|nr:MULTISPECIES: N-acetylmannosamine-6-phosphate 2-epimerase [Clostridia]PWJ31525.1 N-acylglucosamine-6-phosphate 2-epimerase [Faecalicatena orotica]RHR21302.1 N-acetylmannosamine-6-phosphate 2-epimerase [Clostridium sp. AF19-22AC]SSA54733.1 N-acylglucosamine-6-phosphate 2-epimerase [Faecalicatena orotica]
MGNKILDAVRGGLIVSCQALEDEPLHSSFIMQRMAVAAMQGGAAGIRANTVEDIVQIKEVVDLPVIGIIKKVYGDSDVFITPTMKEIDQLMVIRPEIVALDGTDRRRPGNISLEDFFKEVREKYKDQLFMADCSTLEEGVRAAELGFDLIGTTLRGYTEYTKDVRLPDLEMMRTLVEKVEKPVIAEGGIWTPRQLKAALDTGVLAAVVGTAITRPMEITKKFVEVL